MNKLIKVLDRILSVWCYSLMGVMTVAIIATVILRYVFNITFVKAEEAITMVFVATTFFGAALGIREKDHISIAYFSDKAGPGMKKVLVIVVHLTIIFVMVFLFTNSVEWIRKVGKVPLPALQIPSGTMYVMVPITCVLSIFYSIVNIAAEFVHVDEPVYGYERAEMLPDGECIVAEEDLK